MSQNIPGLSASQILQHLDQGDFSAAECADAFLQQVDAHEKLNCILKVDTESVKMAATEIDRKRSSGEKLGRLAGVPVLVKDGICTAGLRTTAGSKIIENFCPTYDATVVRKLKEADAVILGKTNMDEFAMGGSNENPHFGNAANPWNTDCVPGGSSGGSAAAVAARISPLALGSDTGGSIRQPASFCGITGIKPTYGRVSRFGLIAFASSLDQIGPMARTSEDAALMLSVLNGWDTNDSTSANVSPGQYTEGLAKELKGKTIGICSDHLEAGIDPEVKSAVEAAAGTFESLGANVVQVRLPTTDHAVAAYYIIACCEASSNLARYDGVRYTTRTDESSLEKMYSQTRADCFGPEVQRRIMLGTFALSSGYYDQYYLKASKVRSLIKADFDRVFEEVDFVMGPTAPTLPFKIGEKINAPLQMYLADVFTVSANLAGIPAMSFPAGFSSSGLPIGVQLQGRPFAEGELLNAAHQFQLATEWHKRSPFD